METAPPETTPPETAESPSVTARASSGLADSLSDPLQATAPAGDPLSSSPAKTAGPVTEPERFEADGETHTVWTECVGNQTVTYIASKPMPVRTRLAKWSREANGLKDETMKRYLLRLIAIAQQKQTLMDKASATVDPSERSRAVQNAQPALGGSLGVLFKAFDIVYPGIGASVVYRGLHFTKDWQTKRGRSVAAEAGRDFDTIKSEGTYSTASYEIAKALAKGGPVKRTHLEAATKTINEVLTTWLETTDGNREDDERGIAKQRKAIEVGIEKFRKEGDLVKAGEVQTMRDNLDTRFTHGQAQYESQFHAALSRFIDQQSRFEAELTEGSDSGFKDVPFTGIPFISTSKLAKSAVEYAEGKLAASTQKSDTGTVGRVLIYAAPSTALMEAGGIDVWAGLKAGNLNFTTYRKQENEITFAGSIPDEFLRGMTSVTAAAGTDGNTAAAELEASKRAGAFGGLIPLPLNKD